MSAGVKTKYALNAAGDIVSVDDHSVVSGLECRCSCPACGEPLVAKKGEIKAKHFAHHHTESGCAYALETELHIRAKLLLERRMQILLPLFFGKDPLAHEENGAGVALMAIDAIRIEGFCLGKKPDVIAQIAGEDYLIEIAVTHFSDDRKIAHYKAHAVNALEIDLSRIDRQADFESQLNEVLFGPGHQPHYWLSLNPLSSIGQRLIQTLRDEAMTLMKQSKASRDELASNRAQLRVLEPKIKDLVRKEETVRGTVKRLLAAKGKINSMSQLDKAIDEKQTMLAILEGKSANYERELAILLSKDQSWKKANLELMDAQAKLELDRRSLATKAKELALREDALQQLHQALQEHGISLHNIESLVAALDTRSAVEADIIRGRALLAEELEKRQRKLNDLDGKIAELLAQKDFYQKECARLHRDLKEAAQ